MCQAMACSLVCALKCRVGIRLIIDVIYKILTIDSKTMESILWVSSKVTRQLFGLIGLNEISISSRIDAEVCISSFNDAKVITLSLALTQNTRHRA